MWVTHLRGGNLKETEELNEVGLETIQVHRYVHAALLQHSFVVIAVFGRFNYLTTSLSNGSSLKTDLGKSCNYSKTGLIVMKERKWFLVRQLVKLLNVALNEPDVNVSMIFFPQNNCYRNCKCVSIHVNVESLLFRFHLMMQVKFLTSSCCHSSYCFRVPGF